MTQFERSIIDLLCPAIKAKKLIKFWYLDKNEDKVGWRVIEPHQIGKQRIEKDKNETILLTGWFRPKEEQIYYGWDENWKNYILERMSKIEILDEVFIKTRMGYQPLDKKRMSIVYCATAERVI
jgi:hypothetical protein